MGTSDDNGMEHGNCSLSIYSNTVFSMGFEAEVGSWEDWEFNKV